MPHHPVQRMTAAVCLLVCFLSPLVCHGGHDLFTQLVVSELVPTGQARSQAPVSLGIPLSQTTQLQETESFVLVGSRGTQFRILNRWPDKTIRWLAIDALVDIPATEQSITLQLTTGQAPPTSEPIASEQDSIISLNTGPVQATLDPSSEGFLSQLVIKNTPLLQNSPFSLSLGGQALSSQPSHQRDFSIDQNGSVKAIVSVTDHITQDNNQFWITSYLRAYRDQTSIEIEVSVWTDPANPNPVTFPALMMHLPFSKRSQEITGTFDRHTFHTVQAPPTNRPLLLGCTHQSNSQALKTETTAQRTTITLHEAGRLPPGTLHRAIVTLELDPTPQSPDLIASPIIGRATSIETYNDANTLLDKLLVDEPNTPTPAPKAAPENADLNRQSTAHFQSFLQAVDESYVKRFLLVANSLESLWQSGTTDQWVPGEGAALWPLAVDDPALRQCYLRWGESFRDRVVQDPDAFQNADALGQLVHLSGTSNDPSYKDALWKLLTSWLLKEEGSAESIRMAASNSNPMILSTVSAMVALESASSAEEDRLLDLLESLIHQTPNQNRGERWYYEAYLQSGDPEIIRMGQAYLDQHPDESSQNLRHLILAPLRYRIWRPLKVTSQPAKQSSVSYRWTVPARAERYRFKTATVPLSHSFLEANESIPPFHRGQSLANEPRPYTSGIVQTFVLGPSDEEDTERSTQLTGKYLERGAALPAPDQGESDLASSPDANSSGSQEPWFTSGRLLQIALFAIIVATCLMVFSRKRSSSASNLFLSIIVLMVTSACTPESEDVTIRQPSSPEPLREAQTQAGNFKVRYTPSPDPIPLNDHFKLEVQIDSTSDAPLASKIEVNADMPAHGHGINTAPTVESHGDGKFTVEGLLFHMKGDWELYIDVLDGPVRERATFPLSL